MHIWGYFQADSSLEILIQQKTNHTFISFRAARCQFLHRTKADTISFENHTFQETLYEQWMETDSTVPPRLPVLVHLGMFPMGFGDLLSWLLLSHLITVQETPPTPLWLLDHTREEFPSHSTLVLSTTRNDLLTPGHTQDRPGGKGEPCSQICALAQGLGKSPARRNFTSGGMCIHRQPGQNHSTAVSIWAPPEHHFLLTGSTFPW